MASNYDTLPLPLNVYHQHAEAKFYNKRQPNTSILFIPWIVNDLQILTAQTNAQFCYYVCHS